MKKDQEQEKQDKELIENLFSRTFEQSYEQNFDKVYDEVYHEYKIIREKNEYQKFKEDNGYNNLFLKCRELIKTNVKGKTKGFMEGYLKAGTFLVKAENRKKNTNSYQMTLNPNIKEKIEQAVKAELKITITTDKKKKFPENNLENDNNNTKEMTRVLDTKMMYPMDNNNNKLGENNQNNNESKNNNNKLGENNQNNNESKNNNNNNNKLGENKQNNNELKILNNNNISINHNNEKQEYNQKSFNDIENKTNCLKIGNKHSKKKIKDNSIGV